MRQARLYDSEEFTGMMAQHLSEVLKVETKQDKDDPLLLTLSFYGEGEEKLQISLHNSFRTYMNTGDINTAIYDLNGIISSATASQNVEEMMKIDLSYVYPALRESLYVEEAGKEMDLITEPSLPGLNTVYIELKDGYSKLINRSLVENHHRLTEERVKRIAYRNLQSQGWTQPKLSLSSPSRKSCVFDVYLDNPFPIECQFLNYGLTMEHLPETYLIAFTNRETTLVMRSMEKMNTKLTALNLAKKARFTDLVRKSVLGMPHPVSDHIYWLHEGKAQLL